MLSVLWQLPKCEGNTAATVGIAVVASSKHSAGITNTSPSSPLYICLGWSAQWPSTGLVVWATRCLPDAPGCLQDAFAERPPTLRPMIAIGGHWLDYLMMISSEELNHAVLCLTLTVGMPGNKVG